MRRARLESRLSAPPVHGLLEAVAQAERGRPAGGGAQAADVGDQLVRLALACRERSDAQQVRTADGLGDDPYEVGNGNRLARPDVDRSLDIAVEQGSESGADVGDVKEVAQLASVRGGRLLTRQEP